MMSLTNTAFRYNRIVIMLIVILLFSGILAYKNLPKAQDPGFTIRTVVIMTQLPGASPERMELLVTDKIEKKVQEMPEVDNITSESRTGISIIYVNFKESYKIMRPIFDDLRRKVKDITNELPKGISGPNINDEFGDVFGSVYSLKGDDFSYAELKTIADDIRDQLLKLDDIAKVDIHGQQDEVIFVEYNNARLNDLGISPQQLSSMLSSANILSSGGSILTGRERIVLEPTGNYESLEQLRNTVIQLPNNDVVYLGEIATIYRDYTDPPTSVSRSNGKRALAIAISMREGGDILTLGQQLAQHMPIIQAKYPWGIEIEKVWFQADIVETNINNFSVNLMQAVGIVAIIMLLFLGLKVGLVVASLIPAAMIIAFYFMQIFGITINQISLAALIISLGLLVDNAIVMVESILVKQGQGSSAIDAAIESGKELFTPLLISSLTTSAAFMPIGLAESDVGEYTSDIFYVVTITLLISWTLAMTMIPLLSSWALANRQPKVIKPAEGEFSGTSYEIYRFLLLPALHNKLLFCLFIIILFFSAIQGLNYVRVAFIEPSEDPVFTGNFEMPLGTSIETSQKIMNDIDQFIREQYYEPEDGTKPLITNWLTYIGDGGPRITLGLSPPNANPANSFLVANTLNGQAVEKVTQGIQSFAEENYPDLAVKLSRLENGPPVGYPVQIRLSGPDFNTLYQLSDQVTKYLNDDAAIISVKNTWGKKLRSS
jgi:multidrug efflux pump